MTQDLSPTFNPFPPPSPELRLSIDRCKALLLAWPGAIFFLPERQIGKTTAILEVVFEQHAGKALIVGFSQNIKDCLERAYERLYPFKQRRTPMTSPPWPEPMFQSFSDRQSVKRFLLALAHERRRYPIFVDEPDYLAKGVLEELCDLAYHFNTTCTGIGQGLAQHSWHSRHRERRIAERVLAANQK